jgi:hypothetical protein
MASTNKKLIILQHSYAYPILHTRQRKKLKSLAWNCSPLLLSQDLAPLDFHLIQALKRSAAGQHYENEENHAYVVTKYCSELLSQQHIQTSAALTERLESCGDFMEQ